jgi:hypothetical protein
MIARFAPSLLVSFACFLSFIPVNAQTRTAVATPRPAAPAAQPTPSQPQVPPPEAMIILIRSSIVALSQANLTNNYSVLSALGSPTFRQANNPARLQQIFAPFRTNNIDMNPVVFVTPQLKYQPAIQNGRLRLVGYFPTEPMQVNYDLQFEPSGGVWRLFGISVDLEATKTPAPRRPATPGSGR